MSYPENQLRFRLLPSLLLVIAAGGIAWGSSVNVPNTFVGGTPAVADEVNANFAACEAAIDDNDARITDNEGTLDAFGQFGAAKAAFHVVSNGTGAPTVTFAESVPGSFPASVIRFSPGRYIFAFGGGVDLAGNFALATVSGTTAPATVNVIPNDLLDPITQMTVFTLDDTGAQADGIHFYVVIF